MWEKLFNLALSNGIWAVLFLGLLIFVLRDSKIRETKYQGTIDSLGKSLEVVHHVKEDVQEIKQELHQLKEPVRELPMVEIVEVIGEEHEGEI